MLVQFSLNSAEARWVLAEGFWRWAPVKAARRVVVCRSTTGAALMVHRWPQFPWQSFAAGVTTSENVGVLRQPAAEALVTGDSWRQVPLSDIRDLGPSDLIVKSANTYDGRRAGVLLGHRQGHGTMGRIYPELDRTGDAAGCPAKVVVPMLSEKLLPPDALEPSGYPDAALGWASRFMVYTPDLILDERQAITELVGGLVRIVGRGASLDGLSVTSYHVDLPDEQAAAKLYALIDAAKQAQLLPFDQAGVLSSSAGAEWKGSADNAARQ